MQNKSAITRLFIANSISGFAQGICMIAIPWHFTVVLGLHREFGFFYGIVTLVSCIWSLYAGVLIDKFDRRNILVFQSLLGFIILGINAYLGYSSMIPLWLTAGVVFAFTAFLYNIHYANIYSFAQEITPKEHYGRIISWIEIQGQATTILGGALAAVLMQGIQNWNSMSIQPWSLHDIFLMNACA